MSVKCSGTTSPQSWQTVLLQIEPHLSCSTLMGLTRNHQRTIVQKFIEGTNESTLLAVRMNDKYLMMVQSYFWYSDVCRYCLPSICILCSALHHHQILVIHPQILTQTFHYIKFFSCKFNIKKISLIKYLSSCIYIQAISNSFSIIFIL